MPPQPQKDSGKSQANQIESSVIKALQSLRKKFDFDDIVSTTDDSNRTLAHLSVQFGYIVLLEHLVEWRIDLTVADVSGLTALHCAYLKGDQESTRILLRAGAPLDVRDNLGRLPRDLEGLMEPDPSLRPHEADRVLTENQAQQNIEDPEILYM